MREATVTVNLNSTMQTIKQQDKAKPFAAHLTTRLEGINSKLVCALSLTKDTCYDDACGGAPLCF